MMKTVFEDKYLQINLDDQLEILEVIGKKVCDDLIELKQIVLIIEQYSKETNSSKVIFKLEGVNSVGNDNIILKELLPFLGNLGVKNIAIITGKNEKTKVFFEELGNYLNPVKKQYDIQSKHFETRQDGFEWIKRK